MSSFLSVLVLFSAAAQAGDPDACELSLRSHVESKGCNASVAEMKEAGLRTVSCNGVPVYGLIDQKRFDMWAVDKDPVEIEQTLRQAWDVPALTQLSEIFVDVICIEDDGDIWTQIRKRVVTK